MSTTNEKVLQHNVYELTEQLYTSYARNKELNSEIDTLKLKIASQQLVIDELTGELSVRVSRSE